LHILIREVDWVVSMYKLQTLTKAAPPTTFIKLCVLYIVEYSSWYVDLNKGCTAHDRTRMATYVQSCNETVTQLAIIRRVVVTSGE
jgi:hypothetical protein